MAWDGPVLIVYGMTVQMLSTLSPGERLVLFFSSVFAFSVAHNFFLPLKNKWNHESNPPHHPHLYKVPLNILKIMKCLSFQTS